MRKCLCLVLLLLACAWILYESFQRTDGTTSFGNIAVRFFEDNESFSLVGDRKRGHDDVNCSSTQLYGLEKHDPPRGSEALGLMRTAVVVGNVSFATVDNADTETYGAGEHGSVKVDSVSACLRECVAVGAVNCSTVVWHAKDGRCWMKTWPFSRVPGRKRQSFFRPFTAPAKVPVLYSVLAGHSTLDTRLPAILDTWLSEEDSLLIVENLGSANQTAHEIARNASAKGASVTAVVMPLPHRRQLSHWSKGAWKNLAILKLLAQKYSDRPYFAIVDDDTFFIPHNVDLLLHSQFSDPDAPFYLGAMMMSEPDMNKAFYFIQGGAGIVFSRGALRKVSRSIDWCIAKCRQWAGDIRLACCFRNVGIFPIGHGGFWSQDVFHSLVRDNRIAMSQFPLSFHIMREPSWMYDLHHAVLWGIHGVSQCLCNASVRINCTHAPSHPPLLWDPLIVAYRKIWKTRFDEKMFTSGHL